MKEFEVPAIDIRRKDKMSATKLVVSWLKPFPFCFPVELKGTTEVIRRAYWGYINEVAILGNRTAKERWFHRWPRKGERRDKNGGIKYLEYIMGNTNLPMSSELTVLKWEHNPFPQEQKHSTSWRTWLSGFVAGQ